MILDIGNPKFDPCQVFYLFRSKLKDLYRTTYIRKSKGCLTFGRQFLFQWLRSKKKICGRDQVHQVDEWLGLWVELGFVELVKSKKYSDGFEYFAVKL